MTGCVSGRAHHAARPQRSTHRRGAVPRRRTSDSRLRSPGSRTHPQWWQTQHRSPRPRHRPGAGGLHRRADHGPDLLESQRPTHDRAQRLASGVPAGSAPGYRPLTGSARTVCVTAPSPPPSTPACPSGTCRISPAMPTPAPPGATTAPATASTATPPMRWPADWDEDPASNQGRPSFGEGLAAT